MDFSGASLRISTRSACSWPCPTSAIIQSFTSGWTPGYRNTAVMRIRSHFSEFGSGSFLNTPKLNMFTWLEHQLTLKIKNKKLILPKPYLSNYYIPWKVDLQGSDCGLRIRIRIQVTQKERIRPDPDPQHWYAIHFMYTHCTSGYNVKLYKIRSYTFNCL